MKPKATKTVRCWSTYWSRWRPRRLPLLGAAPPAVPSRKPKVRTQRHKRRAQALSLRSSALRAATNTSSSQSSTVESTSTISDSSWDEPAPWCARHCCLKARGDSSDSPVGRPAKATPAKATPPPTPSRHSGSAPRGWLGLKRGGDSQDHRGCCERQSVRKEEGYAP